MSHGPSLKNFEPGYKLLKWAFLDELLALRDSTWSGILISGRALEYSLCFSRLRSYSYDDLGMCCEGVEKGGRTNCLLRNRPAEIPVDGKD
ncbi:unnamed protein product [Soboliphyme baturini]|uniref:Uncharacterized protein n=1 Tax=Soboliphyme baturini TaxID=241478 RepID=A0A183IYR5_9BILA|nr:unnamed protein product [Soboliphyme baturini]